jgi:hypothetical protein
MRLRSQPPEVAPGISAMHPRWEGILRGESPLSGMQRMYRRFFAMIPALWRCKFCNAPFKGPVAGILRWIGYAPSAKNPNICAR